MDLVLDFLKLTILAWAVSGMTSTLSQLIDSKNLFVNVIKAGLGCAKCTSFWLTLGLTCDVYQASLVAFAMYLFGKIDTNNTTL